MADLPIHGQNKVLTEKHLEHCTTQQQYEAVQAVMKHGGLRAAERATGIRYETLRNRVQRVEEKAAKESHAPGYMHNERNLPGFETRFVTARYDADGNLAGEYHRQEPAKQAQQQALQDYVDGLKEDIPQASPAKAKKQSYREDLMPSIFIGDAHVGMRAFGKETKHHDFDTDIAVEQLREAVDYLVDKAEPSENGLLVDVGDYQHANGHNNQTFAGTPLDVDTRHRSTMYEGAMTMRYMVSRMLEKCKNVTVVVARGNHNDDTAPAMELMLRFYYEHEPRVNVLPVHGYYHYLEFGGNLLGVHHGHKQKPEALAGSMARDMAEAWGRTNFRMWCTGHFHKEQVKTLPGCKHKVFGALPPPDGWHASMGFSGDGEMEMLTFKREGGVHSSFVYRIPRPHVEPDVTI